MRGSQVPQSVDQPAATAIMEERVNVQTSVNQLNTNNDDTNMHPADISTLNLEIDPEEMILCQTSSDITRQ